jgi:hypothetical protein
MDTIVGGLHIMNECVLFTSCARDSGTHRNTHASHHCARSDIRESFSDAMNSNVRSGGRAPMANHDVDVRQVEQFVRVSDIARAISRVAHRLLSCERQRVRCCSSTKEKQI